MDCCSFCKYSIVAVLVAVDMDEGAGAMPWLPRFFIASDDEGKSNGCTLGKYALEGVGGSCEGIMVDPAGGNAEKDVLSLMEPRNVNSVGVGK